MRESCVLTSAVRTAVGSYLGSLKTVEEQELCAEVIRQACARSNIACGQVDQVVMGDVYGYTPNVARCAALLAGVPVETPAYTVDRQCASSLQAVVSAVQEIRAGDAEIVVAGGVESMSRLPFYLPPEARYRPLRMGDVPLYDTFSHGVTIVQPQKLYPGLNMGLTAENLAEQYGISREEQDAFAYDSQMKMKRAMLAGRFQDEIVPIAVRDGKRAFVFDTDEHCRPDTTLESLARLRPAFKPDGTVTAGNSSGMNDGASAVVVMRESAARAVGAAPLVRVVSYSAVGVDPSIMGIGPVYAIRKALQKADLTLRDMGLIELNEAFAAQSLAVLRELNISPGSEAYQRVNVNGGAIAHGHALGNSGTRLVTTLVHEMKRRGVRYGLVSLCIGGGQGMAMIFENLP